jgi:hypothetical protein
MLVHIAHILTLNTRGFLAHQGEPQTAEVEGTRTAVVVKFVVCLLFVSWLALMANR